MRRKQLFAIVTGLVIFALAAPSWAQQTVLSKVTVILNRTEKDRRLDYKMADLVLDDASRKLMIRSKARPLEVDYEDIQKVIFEKTRHNIRLSRASVAGLAAVGGALLASAAQAEKVDAYLCYFEYTKPDGSTHPYLLEMPLDLSKQAMERMGSIFGQKSVIADFPEKAETIEKSQLKDIQSRHSVKVEKRNHPLPEIKPDKALVVVVCPGVAGAGAGHGYQQKLHANERVVAVNKQGTYNFFYLDPGEYLLVSQCGDASGMRINLEPGKDYYFIQSYLVGWSKIRTVLSRSTKEIVMYEVSGAYYSDWQREE